MRELPWVLPTVSRSLITRFTVGRCSLTFLTVLSNMVHIQGVILPFRQKISSIQGDEKACFSEKQPD